MTKYEAFLRVAASKYVHGETVRKHLKNCLTSYKDLHLKEENFVFNNGETRTLICLYGTIPVPYRYVNYNIPIGIYLNHDYPDTPPIAYVKPTPDMSLKSTTFLDSTGRLFLPLLHDWHKKRNDLNGLIKKLISIFTTTMPVFSTAGKASPSPVTTSSNQNFSYPISGVSSSYPIQSDTLTSSANNASNNDFNSGLSEQQIRISLLSAVKDKLQRRVQEIFYQNQAELQTLKRTQGDLENGKNNIHNIITKMEEEQDEVSESIVLLKSKNEEMCKVITQMEGKSGVDVDEAVIPIAPIYKQ